MHTHLAASTYIAARLESAIFPCKYYSNKECVCRINITLSLNSQKNNFYELKELFGVGVYMQNNEHSTLYLSLWKK